MIKEGIAEARRALSIISKLRPGAFSARNIGRGSKSVGG